jgi:adenylate kinase
MKKFYIYLIFFVITALGIIIMHNYKRKNKQDKELIVIMLGPPGSGKGTYSNLLKKDLNLPHISTGDLFRENIKNDSALGKKAQEYLKDGKLVPDDLVVDMLFDHINKNSYKKGYILDGFPRTINQAIILNKRVEGNANIVVINLEIDNQVLINRITNRLSCSKCSAIYNKLYKPALNDNKCDICNSDLIQRKDDTKEVIEKRLIEYDNQTKSLIEFYEDKGNLINIDADNQMDKVYSNIKKTLNIN